MQCLSRTASPPRLPSPPKIVLSVLSVTTWGFSQNRVDRASRVASPDRRKVSDVVICLHDAYMAELFKLPTPVPT